MIPVVSVPIAVLKVNPVLVQVGRIKAFRTGPEGLHREKNGVRMTTPFEPFGQPVRTP